MSDTKNDQMRTAEPPHVLARKTLDLIEKLDLTPTPQAYHVFYNYILKEDQEFTGMIDGFIQNTCDLNDDMVIKLYNRYFNITRQSTRLYTDIEDLIATVRQVETSVDTVVDQTGSYGRDLGAAVELFSDENLPREDARSLSQGLLRGTLQMHKTGKSFRKNLETYCQEIMSVMSELENVRREAMTDVLTGIANRKFFELTLRQTAAEAMETGEPMSLLMLDIDRFKNFNDTHGHRAGDGVLKTVARVLVNSTKGADTVARYGGEEFMILLPNTSLENACRLAENVRNRVAGSHVKHKKTGESFGQITVSGGVAEFIRGEALADFIERTDKALYCAKNAGRNRIESAA